MEFGLPDETVSMLKAYFESIAEINKVMIFGSRAIDTYSTSSDIDFAVFSDIDISGKLLAELDELPTPYQFDVVDYNSISHEPLKLHIDRFGKVFYSRKA